MKKTSKKHLDVQHFLSLVTQYSLVAFFGITLILIISSIFIKANLEQQQRMLRVSAITYEQRLVLRELDDSFQYFIRVVAGPINTRLIDQIRQDIQQNYIKLENNQEELETIFTNRSYHYNYWPFNRFYSTEQYEMVNQIRQILNDITPTIDYLMRIDFSKFNSGIDVWTPEFMRTVRRGDHSLTLARLNTQVYESASEQQAALKTLHLYLLIIVILCIWIIWLLILKPLSTRTKFLFETIQNNEKRLKHQATHDSLTGLYNRHYFNTYLHRQKSKRRPQILLLVIDVDNFKMINDSYGHNTGDQILKHISACIQNTAAENEKQFRNGGDEFIIIIEDTKARENCEKRITNLLELLSKPVEFNATSSTITPKISIGIAVQNGDFNNIDELYSAADIALYHVKNKGGDDYAYYYDIETRKISEILKLESDLKTAITNKEFVPYYQPIVEVSSEKIIGFEALARWHHPTLGVLSPNVWISNATRLGLLSKISALITEQVLAHQIQIQDKGYKPLTTTINLTEKMLISDDLLKLVQSYTTKHSNYEFFIGLEIHESIVLQRNFKHLSARISALQSMKFKILIDDFGTGYATITHLLNLPFDYLKTDNLLIKDILSNEKNRVILQAMQNIASGLGKALICEGVETEAILNAIRNIGIPYAQGYYFGRPAPFKQVHTLMNSNQLPADKAS